MGSPRLLIQWLREYGQDARQRAPLIANRWAWHSIWAAVDIVGEADTAMVTYLFNGFPADEGERYLRVFGVIQALFLQQDALGDLIHAVHLGGKIQVNDVFKEISEMREARAGHPTRLNRSGGLSSHAIVANSMTHEGFDLHAFLREGGKHFEHIPVRALVLEQRNEAFRVLSEVVDELRWQDHEHREQFRDVKLVAVFDRVGHAFEKILEGMRRDFVVGSGGVDDFQRSLDDFQRLLGERGVEIDTYGPVKYLYDEIRHPLAELRKFVTGEPSEILSNEGAVVFVRALEGSFAGLGRIAAEIDEEYASEPNPVVPPDRAKPAMIYRTKAAGAAGKIVKRMGGEKPHT